MTVSRLLLVHGAIYNAGDFLIRRRARSLLALSGPQAEIIELPRWADPSAIPEDVDVAIVGGGPALAPNMVPEVQPLVPELLRRRIPVGLLAVGWSGKGQAEDVELSARTLESLKAIRAYSGRLGVRDELTKLIVERALPNAAIMTGCVAWYEPKLIGRQLASPSPAGRVIVTSPASPRLQHQATKVVREVRAAFPDSEIVYSFHRGILPAPRDRRRKGPWKRSAAYLAGAALSKRYGVALLDAGGSDSAFDGYADAVLHVGYRVHAHLHFLSQRKPSFLIAEDGRGRGQQRTLGDPHRLEAMAPDVPNRLRKALADEASNGYQGSQAALQIIDATWPVMEEHLRSIHGSF